MGSGLGLSGAAELWVAGLAEALEAEADTSILRAVGWCCPGGWVKGNGRRLRSAPGGEAEEVEEGG